MDLSTWQSNTQLVCFISNPDSVVIEVQVDKNAIGQDILEKVCESIGTVEKDYFGLQYSTNKFGSIWLNLRNRITSQLSTWQSPLRLKLKVKYFVEPHYLLQEVTRKLFYTQLKQQLFNGKFSLTSDMLSKALATIAQCEIGNYVQHFSQNLFDCYATVFNFTKEDENFDIEKVIFEHQCLDNMTRSAAISQFLYIISSNTMYGMEKYSCKLDVQASTADLSQYQANSSDMNGRISPSLISNKHSLEDIDLLIGPKGIKIVELNTKDSKIIPFRTIHLANSVAKQIDLHIHQDDGSVKSVVIKSNSDSQGAALYKIITEMLAFYTWDTVHPNVRYQHSLDFKGHFIALFRPKNIPDADKQYMFDIQRTAREVHDNARRILYKKQQKLKKRKPIKQVEKNVNNKSEILSSQDTSFLVDSINEALTCNICCDKEIEVVFVPCGHQLCCKSCSEQIESCPFCRVSIQQKLTVFLPINKEMIRKSFHKPTSSVSANHLKIKNTSTSQIVNVCQHTN